MKKSIRELMLAVACLFGLSSGTAVAQTSSAQPAVAQSEEVCTQFASTASRAERFFGRCQIVQGVSLSPAEWQQLRAEGILVTSTFRMDQIEREAVRHGWRSKQVRQAMDKVSAEGNVLTVYELDAEGLRRVQNLKGIDVSQNGFRVTAWSMADDSDGVPMVDLMVFNENWQSIWSKVGAMAIGNTVTGVVTAGANQGFGKLFSTTCKGDCRKGGGAIINVSASATGGDAYAEGGNAQAGAQSSSSAELTTTGSGGACGSSGTCPKPTNPTHTQNGPQGP